MAEVAKILSCGERTVYRLAERNVLPHLRVISSIRFDQRDVEEFIQGKKTGGKYGGR